jgi:hypothetical protein
VAKKSDLARSQPNQPAAQIGKGLELRRVSTFDYGALAGEQSQR